MDLCFTVLAGTLGAGDVDSGVLKQLQKQPLAISTLAATYHMDVGRVSSLQRYCHGATRSRLTQQGNLPPQSVDTCVRLDRNRLCGLRHLAAHSRHSHQSGDSGHDFKRAQARLGARTFQSLYIADVVLRSDRQSDKKGEMVALEMI